MSIAFELEMYENVSGTGGIIIYIQGITGA